MRRSRGLRFISIAAVVSGAALGAVLLLRAAPQGTIALLGAQHGGLSGQVTQVILHGPKGDVTISPRAEPLLAAPAESEFGTFAVTAATYSAVEVRLGGHDLRRATALTVTSNGLTPVLLGFEQSDLTV